MYNLKKLCVPAKVYLAVEILIILGMLFQNVGNNNVLRVGSYECESPNLFVMLLIKLGYVAFWTFILNLLCKSHYKNLAWVIVLFPFMLFFILLGLLMLMKGLN